MLLQHLGQQEHDPDWRPDGDLARADNPPRLPAGNNEDLARLQSSPDGIFRLVAKQLYHVGYHSHSAHGPWCGGLHSGKDAQGYVRKINDVASNALAHGVTSCSYGLLARLLLVRKVEEDDRVLDDAVGSLSMDLDRTTRRARRAGHRSVIAVTYTAGAIWGGQLFDGRSFPGDSCGHEKFDRNHAGCTTSQKSRADAASKFLLVHTIPSF